MSTLSRNFTGVTHWFGGSTLALLLSAVLMTTAYADASCVRVDAYWDTNVEKLIENTGDCDASQWHKCSQAAAIYYDLSKGSLAQRARACDLEKSREQLPGLDYTEATDDDNQQCLNARENLRRVFSDRAQARLACAAAREGGENQEWLDAQCTLHRSRMNNYHAPFRTLEYHCELQYNQKLAHATPLFIQSN